MEQRIGLNDRRLSKEKQTVVSGGDVNYYLQLVINTEVEIEDIIEVFDMSFAIGNVFKALVRICKLRVDLGKPGSTPLYEAQKMFYYGCRALAVSERRYGRTTGIVRGYQIIRNKLMGNQAPNPDCFLITISDPKRLDPYSFLVGDFIDSLVPTMNERAALRDVLALAYVKNKSRIPYRDERVLAQRVIESTKNILSRENIARIQSEQKRKDRPDVGV